MKPIVIALIALVLLAGCGSDDPESVRVSPERVEQALKGSPPALASLHDQANELLHEDREAFEKRLRSLRGHPVVVNKWASWCAPCRAEFPFFQKQGLKRGKEIAFIGLNAQDNDGDAKDFLKEYPVTYPSYSDPEQELAKVFNGTVAFPTTAFYNSKGELEYVRQGGYPSEKKFLEDLNRYAR